MARTPRTVIPGIPHHVTQRGVRRGKVFFKDSDREEYLDLMERYSRKYDVQILAYCLMTTHVHHFLVPATKYGLSLLMQDVHRIYARQRNVEYEWTGHLWQERFFSCPVEPGLFGVVLNYILRNPVEAGIVNRAMDYLWSSALDHSGLREHSILSPQGRWKSALSEDQNWPRLLGTEVPRVQVAHLEECTRRDYPFGSAAFVRKIERWTGVSFAPKKRGRPKRKVSL